MAFPPPKLRASSLVVDSEDESDDASPIHSENDAYKVHHDEQMRHVLLNRMQHEAKQRKMSHSEEGEGDETEEEDEGDTREVPELFREIPEPYAHSEEFQRVIITTDGETFSRENAESCRLILKAIAMREKHAFIKPAEYWGSIDRARFEEEEAAQRARAQSRREHGARFRRRPDPPFHPFSPPTPGKMEGTTFVMRDGVVLVCPVGEDGSPEVDRAHHVPPSLDEFLEDYHEVVRLIHHGPIKSFAYSRLQLIESRFNLHALLNQEKEMESQKSVPHRDFYNVRKVDTHVHHSACMTQKHLLRFIKSKLKHHGNDVVIFRDGQFLTLSEVFKSLSLSAYDLSIDTLDMHAGTETFHRFDRFNLKYNPCGQSRLREIFLKTDNLVAGRYLAEVTKQVFQDLEASKYTMAEYRVSVYGRKRTEWDKLGRWYYVNRLASSNVRWMIQIPRLYSIYKRTGQVESFQDMLDNIFLPLFEVTLHPAGNHALHAFLSQVVGFDCVDDESKNEHFRQRDTPPPAEWTMQHDPPFQYWLYYMNANLRTLNALRASRGMSTFSLRPHAGEAGDLNHLAAAFLTSEHINHGITMRKSAPVQYLYYLAQVGLAMSPLSNNKLFVDYHRNPFYTFFARGLNVSISTDDPLLLHYTKEPLVEEYCVATQVWKLTPTDMCEIARNSVLQSGFEHPYKRHFLGHRYNDAGPAGNEIQNTNVPNIRLQFRHELLSEERAFLLRGASRDSSSPVPTIACFGPSPRRSIAGAHKMGGNSERRMPPCILDITGAAATAARTPPPAPQDDTLELTAALGVAALREHNH